MRLAKHALIIQQLVFRVMQLNIDTQNKIYRNAIAIRDITNKAFNVKDVFRFVRNVTQILKIVPAVMIVKKEI